MNIEDALTDIAESLRILAKNSELAREEAERFLCTIPDAPAPEKPKKAKREKSVEPTPEPAETLTLDYLRENWGKRIAQAGKAPDTKPWMNERDATSLSTLDPKYYPEFVEFAKSLLGE